MSEESENAPILAGEGGTWHDGLCDCCSDPSTCCSRSSGCQWAQTMHRAKVMRFSRGVALSVASGIGIVTVYFLLNFLVAVATRTHSDGDSDADSPPPAATTTTTTVLVAFALVVAVVWLARAACGAWGRGKLRHAYAIDGSVKQDLVIWCCCSCCASCQEARHVDARTNQLGVTRI